IILMDVQMPHMDGNDAVTAIRKAEQTNGTHVPIVGLTAGATKFEREKSLRCGMDDFLTKPIDQGKLKTVLQKFLAFPKPGTYDGGGTDRSAGNEIHFDAGTLRALLNDETIVQSIIEAAKADMPEKISALSEAVSNKNVNEIRGLAHSIKGASLNMRFSRLASLAEVIEEKTLCDDFDGLGQLLEDVRKEWGIVVPLLESNS
ncbi:MAG: response regulator, partial [Chitinivibrionales bacterium]|nr:response regulator [Chitinivibrionales bacterium]